ISYTIQIRNAGPSNAQAVSLADPTPPGLTFVSATAPCASGFPCLLGTMAAGTTVSLTVTFHVPPGYTTPDPIVTTATVSSATPDPHPDDNSHAHAWATAVAPPVANVSIVKTAPASAVAGENLAFTITVTNNGPSNALDLVMTDVLTDELTFQ